jgi:hypothetical protein
MRPLLALALTLGIFAAVGGYLRFAEHTQRRAPASQEHEAAVAAGAFDVEITLTFDAGADAAFSLDPTQATALRVEFRGRELLRREQPVAAGTPLHLEKVKGITPGANEFFIEAQPANQSLGVAHAVRVRVLRDSNPIADQTLWSDPGLPVRGAVSVEIPRDEAEHSHF